MKARKQAWHVCSAPGCGQLVNTSSPCPRHGRPTNASWSTDRDRNTQREFRKRTLTRDGYQCRRCGHRDYTGRSLDAHHVTPTEGLTLCNSKGNGCHAKHDKHAR